MTNGEEGNLLRRISQAPRLVVTAGVVLVVLYLTLWRAKRPNTRRAP